MSKIRAYIFIASLCFIFIAIISIPFWCLGTFLSREVEYWHVVLFMILISSASTCVWASECAPKYKRFYAALALFLGALAIAALAFYVYIIFIASD